MLLTSSPTSAVTSRKLPSPSLRQNEFGAPLFAEGEEAGDEGDDGDRGDRGQ